MKLKELQEKLTAKQDTLAAIFKAGGEDVDFSNGEVLKLTGANDSAGAVEAVRALNLELEDLGKQLDERAELKKIEDNAKQRRAEPAKGSPALPDPGHRQEVKTLGQMVVESDAFKSFRDSKTASRSINDEYGLKTLFQRTAGWAAESIRIPGLVIDDVTRPIQVTDLVPTGVTGMAAVVYMEETTRTHASAERAEGATYAESTFELTERTSPVQTIGTSIPVTDEQLQDVVGVQSYLEGRLVFGNRQRFDNQIINGDGSTPNLQGILLKSGIQTQAKGADPVPDAIYKAMTKIRITGRAFPNAVVINPNDWQQIRLLRTSDGIYIWGHPSEAGVERIWGILVVQGDVIAEGTGLVGDFANFIQMHERRGMEVAVGFVDDDFKKGRQTIRAGFRVALTIYRAAAFATVTGI